VEVNRFARKVIVHQSTLFLDFVQLALLDSLMLKLDFVLPVALELKFLVLANATVLQIAIFIQHFTNAFFVQLLIPIVKLALITLLHCMEIA